MNWLVRPVSFLLLQEESMAQPIRKPRKVTTVLLLFAFAILVCLPPSWVGCKALNWINFCTIVTSTQAGGASCFLLQTVSRSRNRHATIV